MIVTSGSGVMSAEGKEYKLEEGYVFYIAPGRDVRYQPHSQLTIHEAAVQGRPKQRTFEFTYSLAQL